MWGTVQHLYIQMCLSKVDEFNYIITLYQLLLHPAHIHIVLTVFLTPPSLLNINVLFESPFSFWLTAHCSHIIYNRKDFKSNSQSLLPPPSPASLISRRAGLTSLSLSRWIFYTSAGEWGNTSHLISSHIPTPPCSFKLLLLHTVPCHPTHVSPFGTMRSSSPVAKNNLVIFMEASRHDLVFLAINKHPQSTYQ